ncbi:MAG: YebC/PmpR family DNA-binding transcriptional regulator [Pseudomonadota bacterium]|nr:YebC/PmpR family DNA-binding transcriptional regulator [Pseudomonadota bacterium]
MAGHSKFKNIMHRKGAQDKKRAKLFSRLIREISVASKIGGSDPDSNPRLRTAINNALSSNMAKENIQRAVKKNISNSEAEQIHEIIYEGFGPNGVAVIVESLTDNKNRSASEVRSTFAKFNGNLGISGSVKHNFYKVGVISYSKEIDNFENFFEFCASLDAKDIIENEDSYDVISEPESFHEIIFNLEKEYSVAKFSSVEWRPINKIDIDDEDSARKLLTLLEKLEDLDDVQSVVSNFNINDNLMEKII